MIEQTPEKDIKQKQNNHNDEEIEIDLIGILRKIIGIRKTIYKAAGIGLVVGIIVCNKYSQTIYGWSYSFS